MNELDKEDIALIVYSLEVYRHYLEWSVHKESVQRVLDKVKEIQENKCVCTDEPPYQECSEHNGY